MTQMMTRPRPIARAAPPLIRPVTVAAFVTMFGLISQEWIGSGFIYLAVLLWIPVVGRDVSGIGRDILRMGVVPWIMPAFCLASAAWSPVAGATFRGGLELFLTVGLALLCVRMLQPREMTFLIWLGFAVIVCLSVVHDNQYHDFDTGRISSAGVFVNKNTLGSCAGALALVSCPVMLNRRQSLLTRLAAFAMLGLGCVMNYRAHSVADTVAMGICLVTLAGLLFGGSLPRYARKTYARMLMLVGVVVAALGSFVTLTFTAELLKLVGKNPTLTGRTLLWYYASEFQKSNPWFGRGFLGFWWQGQPQAEFLWKMEHIASRTGFSFHSLFWQLLVDVGYVGLAIGIVSIAVTIWHSVRWLAFDPTPTSAFFFSAVLFSLIIQLQGIDLFQLFTSIYFLFLLAFGYGQTEVKRVMAARQVRRYAVMIPAE